MIRALKWTGIVLVIPGAIWVIGCLLSDKIAMIREHQELTVKQPREKIFEFLNDESNAALWINGIVSIEPIGEPKEGLGSQVKIVVNVPSDMEIISTVTEWDPPKRFAWTGEVEGFTGVQTYQLEEVEGGTKIILDVEHRRKDSG